MIRIKTPLVFKLLTQYITYEYKEGLTIKIISR